MIIRPLLPLHIYRLSPKGDPFPIYIGSPKDSFAEESRLPRVKSYNNVTISQFSKAVAVLCRHEGNDSELIEKIDRIIFAPFN